MGDGGLVVMGSDVDVTRRQRAGRRRHRHSELAASRAADGSDQSETLGSGGTSENEDAPHACAADLAGLTERVARLEALLEQDALNVWLSEGKSPASRGAGESSAVEQPSTPRPLSTARAAASVTPLAGKKIDGREAEVGEIGDDSTATPATPATTFLSATPSSTEADVPPRPASWHDLSPSDGESCTQVELEDCTVADLRARCKRAGLRANGSKDVLIRRLLARQRQAAGGSGDHSAQKAVSVGIGSSATVADLHVELNEQERADLAASAIDDMGQEEVVQHIRGLVVEELWQILGRAPTEQEERERLRIHFAANEPGRRSS